MESLDIEAIRERCEKATLGPWGVVAVSTGNETKWWVYGRFPFPEGKQFGAEWVQQSVFGVDGSCSEENANFVAAAHQDIPALLDEIVRLRAELDRVQALLAQQQEP